MLDGVRTLLATIIALIAPKLSNRRESTLVETSKRLVDLPDELLLIILSSLARLDLLSLARASPALHNVVQEALPKATPRTLHVHAVRGEKDYELRRAIRDKSILRTIAFLDILGSNFSECPRETIVSWPPTLWRTPCNIPSLTRQGIFCALYSLLASLPDPVPIRFDNILMRRTPCTWNSPYHGRPPIPPEDRPGADITPHDCTDVSTKHKRRSVRLESFSADAETPYGKYSILPEPTDVDLHSPVPEVTSLIINLRNSDLCGYHPPIPKRTSSSIFYATDSSYSLASALRPVLEQASATGFPIVIRSWWSCCYDPGGDICIKRT